VRNAAEVDCAIVGAGILGLAVAHELTRVRPDWRILVLDRSLIGSGATSFSAGLHIPYGRSERLRRLSLRSEHAYAAICRTSTTASWTPLSCIAIVNENDAAHQSSCFTGPHMVRIGAEISTRSIGSIRVPRGMTAFSLDNCHCADVPAIAQELARMLRRSGVSQIWEGVEVSELRSAGDSMALVLADGRHVDAGRAVLAPGPWIWSGPGASVAEKFAVRTKKVVSFHLDIVPDPGDPVVCFLDEDAFLLPLAHRGHWLFSYACQQWDVLPCRSELRPEPADRKQAEAILARFCPHLIGRLHSGRAFCDSYSRGREPVVARMPEIEAPLVFVGAASGSGYRLAPGIAGEVGDLLINRR
jgi:glycine/D-amino acid oxidase-like deaminating enzyme